MGLGQVQRAPGDVMALTVLLANGEVVTCLHNEQGALVYATLSGAAVHRADRDGAAVARACPPVQETVPFDDVVGGFGAILTRSEHVRLW